jgi:hypothetical protein
LIAEDKNKFLDNISTASDRQILKILIEEYSEKYEENMKELHLPEDLR